MSAEVDPYERLRIAKRQEAVALATERRTRQDHEAACRELEESRAVVDREMRAIHRKAEIEAGIRPEAGSDYEDYASIPLEYVPVKK